MVYFWRFKFLNIMTSLHILWWIHISVQNLYLHLFSIYPIISYHNLWFVDVPTNNQYRYSWQNHDDNLSRFIFRFYSMVAVKFCLKHILFPSENKTLRLSIIISNEKFESKFNCRVICKIFHFAIWPILFLKYWGN